MEFSFKAYNIKDTEHFAKNINFFVYASSGNDAILAVAQDSFWRRKL